MRFFRGSEKRQQDLQAAIRRRMFDSDDVQAHSTQAAKASPAPADTPLSDAPADATVPGLEPKDPLRSPSARPDAPGLLQLLGE